MRKKRGDGSPLATKAAALDDEAAKNDPNRAPDAGGDQGDQGDGAPPQAIVIEPVSPKLVKLCTDGFLMLGNMVCTEARVEAIGRAEAEAVGQQMAELLAAYGLTPGGNGRLEAWITFLVTAGVVITPRYQRYVIQKRIDETSPAIEPIAPGSSAPDVRPDPAAADAG